MKPRRRSTLGPILQLFNRSAGARLRLGAALALLTLLAGMALLGVSGWFITATALAALAPVGALAFNIFVPSASIRLLALVRTAGRYAERLVTHDATLAVLAALRERLFRGWAAPQAARALARRPARLLFRLTQDVDALESVYLRLLVPAVAAGGALLLVGAVLGWLDLRLGLAVVAWLALVGGTVVWQTMRRARALALRRARALERLRERAIDLVAGQTELALAGRLPAQCDAIDAADHRLATAESALQRLELRAGLWLSIAGGLCTAAVLLALAALVQGDGLSAPAATLALLLVLTAMEPFAALRRGALEAGRAGLAARRIAPRLQDDATSQPAPPSPPPDGIALRLRGVVARYPGANAAALHGLDLDIALGERVAVVGASGAGKSTLLMLAAGELAPQAGVLQALPATWLTQHCELFNDSLRDNLRLAQPQADDAALWAALHAAGLEADVRGFAQGLDTRLGEGGLGLSGGQARRLALARLLLRPDRFWLLDEPTESLDAPVARDVLHRLREAAQGRTLLITTHLRREAELADRLWVLRHGRIAADHHRGSAGFEPCLRTLRGDD